jgi:HAD superfamily hydrolase (TIGR01509 family)
MSSSPPINHIFFDWDGCLANTLQIWLETYTYTLGQYNIHLSNTEIGKLIGDWNAALKYNIDDKETFIEQFNKKGDELLPKAELHNHPKEILDMLYKNDFKLALLTSALRESLEPLLNKFDVTKYFDLIITSNEVENHKPNPESINKALKYFKIEPNQAIMIGDSDKDIKAAKNAGVKSVLFFPPQHKVFYNKEDLVALSPNYIIEDLLDLTEIIGIE